MGKDLLRADTTQHATGMSAVQEHHLALLPPQADEPATKGQLPLGKYGGHPPAAHLSLWPMQRPRQALMLAHDGSTGTPTVVTALMLAAYGGHTETVTELLAAPGLDVNKATGGGPTALTAAAVGGHTETVTALLAAPGLDVNAAARDGSTALAFAEGQGHVACASLLRARRLRSQ